MGVLFFALLLAIPVFIIGTAAKSKPLLLVCAGIGVYVGSVTGNPAFFGADALAVIGAVVLAWPVIESAQAIEAERLAKERQEEAMRAKQAAAARLVALRAEKTKLFTELDLLVHSPGAKIKRVRGRRNRGFFFAFLAALFGVATYRAAPQAYPWAQVATLALFLFIWLLSNARWQERAITLRIKEIDSQERREVGA